MGGKREFECHLYQIQNAECKMQTEKMQKIQIIQNANNMENKIEKSVNPRDGGTYLCLAKYADSPFKAEVEVSVFSKWPPNSHFLRSIFIFVSSFSVS